jgi:glucose/mannose-6-phosphate isomerase
MFDLDDVKIIHAMDAHDMLWHVIDLPQQLIDGWAAAEAIELPTSFRGRSGGVGRHRRSGGGGACLRHWSRQNANCPSTLRDYELPAYAHGAHTLVIAISYSGDTEETLAVFEQANTRLSVAVLAANGRFLERAKKQARPISASIIRHGRGRRWAGRWLRC